MSVKATAFEDYCQAVSQNFVLLKELAPLLAQAAKMWQESLEQGGRIFFCGNGGSAADAQHLAAELVVRYKKDRSSLAGLALTVDSSALTAISNDYGYDYVFSRQLEALAKEGDLLVAISTSGHSGNVIKAVEKAAEMGVKALAFTGHGGGRLKYLCDLVIAVPSSQTNHIQEMHIAVGHFLCGRVEQSMGFEALSFKSGSRTTP